MLDKLKRQFPSLLVHEEVLFHDQYTYFQMDDGQYLSIDKEELSEKDITLLSIFLTPILHTQEQSTEINLWKNYLLSRDNPSYQKLLNLYDKNSMFRLIHFHLHTPVEQTPFEEAVSSLSISSPLVLWISESGGVLIEQIKQEFISLEDLRDLQNAITTDFYTDLHLFVGKPFSISESISQQYHWESISFKQSREIINNRNIYRFYEMIPYSLLRESNEEAKNKLQSLLLGIPENELESIKVFIENGLNVSLAAKKLFMHRNSLQYRVEKFIEKTGVDIKSFEGALVIYLAILGSNQ
ncbi:PucR family transcriptional regulator [Bacillus pinisoli]|uniref:PucR family transcriptional regulator n=1 Tax=Bacillus pinisoli TaxID=2901866 RepID=UPI001FF4E2A1|nr:helix-turn-helix domain-containing protein [Bacillus pinisoli]